MFLLCASLALLFLTESPSRGSSRPRGVAAVLGLLGAAGAIILSISYLYGAPLFYGTAILPVSITSTLAYISLGVGLVAAAGPEQWPLRLFVGPSVRARLLRTFVPLTLVAILLPTGTLISALGTSALALVFALIAGALSYHLAASLGESIEAAERARAELARTLNAEVNHRVKNNLAMAASLLQTQGLEEPDPRVTTLLKEHASRLLVFAQIHEQLQVSPEGRVDILGALSRLAEAAKGVFAARGLEVVVEGEPVELPSRAATHLLIVANELLTNAAKYCAPTEQGTCEVSVGVRMEVALQAGQLLLTVWNSGNPVPEDFRPRPPEGAGACTWCGR